jgi:hypothetical protein
MERSSTTPIGDLARPAGPRLKTVGGPVLAALGSLAMCLTVGQLAGAEPNDDAAEVARSKGMKLFEEQDFTRAITEFERAYRLRPHHSIQCSIARCNEGMNRVVEAAEHYRRCLKEGADATKMAGQIRSLLKSAEARITWINVLSPSSSGAINLGGLAGGGAPRRLPLNPGSHTVNVQRPGAKPASFTLQTLGGEPVAMALVPLVAGSTVSLVQAKGLDLQKPPPRPKPQRRRVAPIWFWTSVALTTALLGATAALGIQTVNQHSDYEGSPTKAGYESFENLRLSTNILFTLTAIAAGTSTVLFFFTDFSGGGANGGPQERRFLGSLGTAQGRL